MPVALYLSITAYVRVNEYTLIDETPSRGLRNQFLAEVDVSLERIETPILIVE
jgi:hypothetical protein